MQFEGAIVCQQGDTFAVVAVKRYIVDSAAQGESKIRSFAPVFPGIPIVLMGQDHSGPATFLAAAISQISSPASLPAVFPGGGTQSEIVLKN